MDKLYKKRDRCIVGPIILQRDKSFKDYEHHQCATKKLKNSSSIGRIEQLQDLSQTKNEKLMEQ